MSSDQPNMEIDQLKAKFNSAKELLDQKIVPIDILSEFADYLSWVEQKGPLNTVY